jgi:HAD superfamily hydrolase (TIGR01509 family)/HAD superfamily hydrolase (TIGR01549 family)
LTTKNQFRYDMVIFDVGGTLLAFHEQAPFQEFLAQVGLPATEQDARRFHRRLISVILAERDHAQGLGADERELNAWWHGIYEKTWPQQPDLTGEMFRWQMEGRFERPFADALPALDSLQRLGLPLAILSNWGTHLRDVLRRFDLLETFQFVIVSSEVGLAKPDRRIFDLAAERAGRPRQRLLYVGDHLGDDIEGAWGAGLDAVLIDRRDHQSEALCPRIRSLEDLARYVLPPAGPARAIIFDMDGVVLASPPMHLATWQQTLAPLGIKLTAEELFPLEGTPTELTAQRLTERFLGQACSEVEARRLAAHKRALFRDIFDPSLVPGVGPLLHDLRGRGYRLGLVTGSARSVVDESLAPTGVAALFDAIVAGDQVTRGKPDPEPYRAAADQLGVQAAECLVVENAPLGIRSARAAGMACVALQTTLDAGLLSAAGAEQVFVETRALRQWLLNHR